MWIHPGVLSNDFLRLEPLEKHHYEGLFRASDLDNFKFWQNLVPQSATKDAFSEFLEKIKLLPNCVPMVMIIQDGGRIVGFTCFMDIREIAKGIEIGMTWINKDFRGSIVNPCAKYLMLQYAFEKAGAIRVQLKTDERNKHSQAAITKLGAKLEGTLRQHGIQINGFVRDTVMFSILPQEWPEIKAELQKRIERNEH